MKSFIMEKSILSIMTLSVFVYAVHCQQTLVNVATEALCTQSPILNPSGDNRWAQAGLDVYVDTYITCGDIIAFQLEWFPVGSGKWSGWYVVGVNDIDTKSDGPLLTLKRMWSYFADHRHYYVICTQNKFIGCNCNSKSGSPQSPSSQESASSQEDSASAQQAASNSQEDSASAQQAASNSQEDSASAQQAASNSQEDSAGTQQLASAVSLKSALTKKK